MLAGYETNWKRILIFCIVSMVLILAWANMAIAFIQNDDTYLIIAAATVFSAMITFATIILFSVILFKRKEEKK